MPATFKAVLNNKPKQDGSYAILIRITMDRKRKSVNTGETIRKADFNPRKGEVRKSHPFHESINGDIESAIEKAQEKIRQKRQQGINLTIDQIQSFMQGKEEAVAPQLLVAYAAELVELYYKDNTDQYRHFWTTLNRFKEFEQNKGREYKLKDFDLTGIKEFENYLRTEVKNHQRTIANHLKRLKRIYKLAVAHGVVAYHENPFIDIKIKRGQKSGKPRLSAEEIKALEEVQLNESLLMFHARNIWLAQFYCAGTRIGDMLTMKFLNLAGGRLIFTMQKTEEENSILIPKKAQAIFDYYREGKELSDYIFPFFKKEVKYDKETLRKQIWSKTASINNNLKKVAELAGIEKNLTTHMARHTFADLARKKSKDIYGVSKALRHSSTKITEEYLNSFDYDAVDDVMGSVFDEE
jgi:integrase/recombinase XerD